ncbi:hypothetical protein C3L33_23154, partial [Rhododendron williamsianum]
MYKGKREDVLCGSLSWSVVDNVDLGTACGKYFRVSCLSIIDPGITVVFLYHEAFLPDSTITSWLNCFIFISSGDSDIIKTLPGDHHSC